MDTKGQVTIFKNPVTGDLYDIRDEAAHTEINNLKSTVDTKANTNDVYIKGDIDSKVTEINEKLGDYAKNAEVYGKGEVYTKSEVDEKVAGLVNKEELERADYASENYVNTEISNLVNGANESYDTLKELQDALETTNGNAAAMLTDLTNKIKAITPPAVTFAHQGTKKKDLNYTHNVDGSESNEKLVSAVTIYEYAKPEEIPDPDDVNTENDYPNGRCLARDGDFAFPRYDGLGQVNFVPTLADGYVIDIDATTKPFLKDNGKGKMKPAGYKSFKTPYLTGITGCYRITKITDDLDVKLVAKKESEYQGHTLTYKLITADGYAGELPKLRIFRSGDLAEKFNKYGDKLDKYIALNPDIVKGIEKEFPADSKIVVGKTYNDDTGYEDNGTDSGVYFKLENVPEGLACSPDNDVLSTFDNTKITTAKCVEDSDLGKGVWTVSKVDRDATIIITLGNFVKVSYNPGYYVFSNDPAEIPANIAQGSDLVFTYYYRHDTENATDKNNPENNKYIPTDNEVLQMISSIKIDGAEISEENKAKLKIIKVSGKKRTITIPGEVLATAKTVEIKLSDSAVYDETKLAATAA